MAWLASATRCDHRNAHAGSDCASQRTIKSGLSTITVHRGEQDLASAAIFRLDRPLLSISSCWLSTAPDIDLPRCGSALSGVNCYDDCLRAVTLRNLGNEPG